MWGKRQDMIVRNPAPFNAEPPVAALLADGITTGVETFFCRNHGSFPDISPAQWRLRVDGLVDGPLNVSYQQLTTEFPAAQVIATLACAGNRRAELLDVRPIPGKEPWSHGAVSTAEWVGTRLADVLVAAGVHQDEGLHVAFAAPDVANEARPVQAYGSSIPLPKAMSAEVLLAWRMNGQPLPRIHGGPVRVVVPGYIGARSIKWVDTITVQRSPSDNYFQALDYRILPPDSDPDTAAPGEGISLSAVPLNCDILAPAEADRVESGALTVRGYALTADGRDVARVEVSADNGFSWQQAVLEPSVSPWAWRFWSHTARVGPGPLTLLARAWDDAGTTQPESAGTLWNPRGYGNNAWARIELTAV